MDGGFGFVPGGVDPEGVLPGAPGAVVVLSDLSVLVEVSDRLVVLPVLGRSHAAMPNASSAGNATMRIRFTRFS